MLFKRLYWAAALVESAENSKSCRQLDKVPEALEADPTDHKSDKISIARTSYSTSLKTGKKERDHSSWWKSWPYYEFSRPCEKKHLKEDAPLLVRPYTPTTLSHQHMPGYLNKYAG